MTEYAYVLIERTGFRKQEAVAAIVYGPNVTTSQARAEKDFRALGHTGWRVRLESQVRQTKAYTGRRADCKVYRHD